MRRTVLVMASVLLAFGCSAGPADGVPGDEGRGVAPPPACDVGSASEWRPISAVDAPEYGGGEHHALWTRGGMALLKFDGSGAILDLCGDSWSSVGRSSRAAPSGSALRTRTELLFPTANNATFETSIFNHAERSWRRIGGDVERGSFSARAWTGDAFMIWGGLTKRPSPTISGNPSMDTQEGVVLDGATGVARPMSKVGAPSARSKAAASWTGSAFFVWGGVSNPAEDGALCPHAVQQGCVSHTDGAIYDPALDTWRPLPIEGAPPALTDPATVWTGKVVLLWDQVPGALPTQPIHAFDPAKNTWRTMAAMPRSFSRDDGDWSGGRLVFLGNGGGHSFDPEANVWTQIPAPVDLTGCPIAVRPTFEADRVVVVTPSSCRDGRIAVAAYDPRKGTPWVVRELPPVPVSVTLPMTAPTSHFSGKLVWTGKQLIAWGGAYSTSASTGCEHPPPGVGCDPVSSPLISTNQGYVIRPW